MYFSLIERPTKWALVPGADGRRNKGVPLKVYDVRWRTFGLVGRIEQVIPEGKRTPAWVVRDHPSGCLGTRREALHKLLAQYVGVPFSTLERIDLDHPDVVR